MFDWAPRIALHAMQGNQASSPVEGEVSYIFRGAVGNWDIVLSYGRDGHSKLVSIQQCQDSSLVTRDNSGISMRLARAISRLLEVKRETQSPVLVATVILGFL